MHRRHTSFPTHPDDVPGEVLERMRRADALVRPWTDPDFRARINPDVPEFAGPPVRRQSRRT